MVTNRQSLETVLADEHGHLVKSIDLGEGVELTPEFTSVKSSRAVGDVSILAFVLSIPAGIITTVASKLLYDWLRGSKVTRIRIHKREISITDNRDRTIKLLEETLDSTEEK